MAVSNNLSYPTFARTKPTDAQISKSVVSILKKFGWKKVTFVHTDEQEFQHTAETIYKVRASQDWLLGCNFSIEIGAIAGILRYSKKVKVCNDQEIAQSERNFHSKN